MTRLTLELIQKVTDVLSKSPGLVDLIGLATYLVNAMKDKSAFTEEERARVLKILRREIDNSIPQNSGVTADEVIDVAIRAGSKKGLQRLLAEDVEETTKAMKRKGRVSAADAGGLSPVLGGHHDVVAIEHFNDALDTIKASIKSAPKDSPEIIKFYVKDVLGDSKFSGAVAKHWVSELKKIREKLSSKPGHPALQAIDEAIKSVEGHARAAVSVAASKAADVTQSMKSYEQALGNVRGKVQDAYAKYASIIRRHHTTKTVQNIKRVIEALESLDDPKKLQEIVAQNIGKPSEQLPKKKGKEIVTVTGGDEMAKRKGYVNVPQRIRGAVNTLLTTGRDTVVVNFKGGHAIILRRTGDNVEVNYNFGGKRHSGTSFSLAASTASGEDIVDDIARKINEDYATALKSAQEKGVFKAAPQTQKSSTVKVSKKQQKMAQVASAQTATGPKTALLIPSGDVSKIEASISEIYKSASSDPKEIVGSSGNYRLVLKPEVEGNTVKRITVEYYGKSGNKEVNLGRFQFSAGDKSKASDLAGRIKSIAAHAEYASIIRRHHTTGDAANVVTTSGKAEKGGAAPTAGQTPAKTEKGTGGGSAARAQKPATTGGQQQSSALREISKGIDFLKNNPTAGGYNVKLTQDFGLRLIPVRDQQGALKGVKTVAYIRRGDEYVAVSGDKAHPVRWVKKTPANIYEEALSMYRERDALFEKQKEAGLVAKVPARAGSAETSGAASGAKAAGTATPSATTQTAVEKRGATTVAQPATPESLRAQIENELRSALVVGPQAAPQGAITSIDVLPPRDRVTQQIAMEQVPRGAVKRTVANVSQQTKVPSQTTAGRVVARMPDGTLIYGTRDDIKAVLGTKLRQFAGGAGAVTSSTATATTQPLITETPPMTGQRTIPTQAAGEAAAIKAAASRLPAGGAAAGELAAGETLVSRMPKWLQTMKGKPGSWVPWALVAALAAPYVINWIRGRGQQEQVPVVPQTPQAPIMPPQMVMPPNVAPSPADFYNALMLRQIMEDDLRRSLSGYDPAGLMQMPMGGGLQAMPMATPAPMVPAAPIMTQ